MQLLQWGDKTLSIQYQLQWHDDQYNYMVGL